jgi:hypothetical protein
MKNHTFVRGIMLQRLTVSLPEDLVKKVKRASHESGLKVSRIVVTALEQHLGGETSSAEPLIRPTVLWKLKGRSRLRAPSPTLRGKPVGSWRIIEVDKLPV